MSNATGSSNQGSDGFFSKIGDAFSEGLQRIGADILPVWAAEELRRRTEPRDRPTFDADPAPPRNDDGMRTTSGPAVTGTVANAFGFGTGALTISPPMLLAIVAAVGVVAWIAFSPRRA